MSIGRWAGNDGDSLIPPGTEDEKDYDPAWLDLRDPLALHEHPSGVRKVSMTLPPLVPEWTELGDFDRAESLRGHVVRGFFWCIRWWKPSP